MKIKDFHPKEIVRRIKNRPPVVGAIRLSGVIAAHGGPARQALNLAQMEDVIEEAFELSRLKAVALLVNSPGGSPVQSALLHDRIRALAAEKEVPVYVFCEDVAASGGYWIACAGDEIYANENSIVGSIGVIAASFGFEEMIAKLGVERRVHTAGKRKSFLDPFVPENKEDVERLLDLQRQIHETFKSHVKSRRGDKLADDEEDLFSGDFWTAREAQKRGLIDDLGDSRQVLREKFGDKVKIREIEAKKGWLQRRMNFGADTRGDLVEQFVATVNSRSLWQRFGL
jgi:signal peptide peptidase SppA